MKYDRDARLNYNPLSIERWHGIRIFLITFWVHSLGQLNSFVSRAAFIKTLYFYFAISLTHSRRDIIRPLVTLLQENLRLQKLYRHLEAIQLRTYFNASNVL